VEEGEIGGGRRAPTFERRKNPPAIVTRKESPVNALHLTPDADAGKWLDELMTLAAEVKAVAKAHRREQARIEKIRDPLEAMRRQQFLIANIETFITEVGEIRDLLGGMIARSKAARTIH
jgi:hypothetical protein